MSDEVSKQRIWPVFALAALLMGLGSLLAMRPDSRGAPPMERADGAPPMPVIDELTDVDAVEFTRDTQARSMRVNLWQERLAGDHAVQTTISLVVRESEAEQTGDVHTFERSYSDVEIAIESDDQPLGQGLVLDVERLVRTARYRVRMKATGEVTELALLSTEAAQLKPVLDVIEQVLAVANPRLPREAVRTGETWTWSAPFEAASEVANATGRGKTEFVAKVLGATDEGIAMQIDIDTHSLIELAESGEPAAPLGAELKGTGDGVVIWDVDRGRIVTSDLHWTTQSRAGTEEIRTSVRVHIESE